MCIYTYIHTYIHPYFFTPLMFHRMLPHVYWSQHLFLSLLANLQRERMARRHMYIAIRCNGGGNIE